MKYSGPSKKVENNELEKNLCQTQSELTNALASDPTSYFCINKQHIFFKKAELICTPIHTFLVLLITSVIIILQLFSSSN